MRLADLKPYIGKKYHTGFRRLPDSPGVYVLVNPHTGKWAAVLVQQWDSDLGMQIECCDIKCGQDVLSQISASYLSGPFRMKGENWVGVRFCDETKPDVVFRLLDKAMKHDSPYGCQIVLGKDFVPKSTSYHETLLPREKPDFGKEKRSVYKQIEQSHDISLENNNQSKEQFNRQIQNDQRIKRFEALFSHDENKVKTPVYVETPLPAAPQNPVRERFQAMRRLYHAGDCSFEQKSKNFYDQGKFMEDFEPETTKTPCVDDVRLFFPRYNDLTDRQLFEYFVWRRNIRNGIYSKICISVAYIYLYELLNQIGTSSVRDSLEKLTIFDEKYIQAGFGDETMQKNVSRWKFELAILNPGNDLSKEEIMSYVSVDLLKRDRALIILQSPEKYDDQEVFGALIEIGEKPLDSSPAFQKKSADGVHLFAQAWRIAVERTNTQNRNIFKACFGELYSYPWHPLGNAVYYQKEKPKPTTCGMNECRKYVYDGGKWTETCYYDLNFNKTKLNQFIRETDRKLRIYLKCGRALKERKEQAWASIYIDEAIGNDIAQKAEALHPKVTICFSDLDRIRADAGETRERLLTDEERDAEAVMQPIECTKNEEISANATKNLDRDEPKNEVCVDNYILNVSVLNEISEHEAVIETVTASQPASGVQKNKIEKNILDNFQVQILKSLLKGETVKEMILARRGLPEIVADSINEAMYDEIGDSVIRCEGDVLVLEEDYREDIEKILGEIAE